MVEAWDIKPDSVNGFYTILAILDTGFELEHDDLPLNCFVAPYDAMGGHPTQIPQPDGDPRNQCDSGDAAYKFCYHGTTVLGMVAPVINNDEGLAGIEHSVKIKPIKISHD